MAKDLMAMFQCDTCGCVDSHLTSNSGHRLNNIFPLKSNDEHLRRVAYSYKRILGIHSNREFGKYCSACCPLWTDEEGQFGLGPIPDMLIGGSQGHKYKIGIWHRDFIREFYIKFSLVLPSSSGNIFGVPTGTIKIGEGEDFDWRSFYRQDKFTHLFKSKTRDKIRVVCGEEFIKLPFSDIGTNLTTTPLHISCPACAAKKLIEISKTKSHLEKVLG